MTTYNGTNGRDVVDCPTGPGTFYLKGGDDRISDRADLTGSGLEPRDDAGADIAYLGDGDDFAEYFGLEDTVYGGRGDDAIEFAQFHYRKWLYTSYDGSFVDGQAGNDFIVGANTLIGGLGDDTLVSYGGVVDGGKGNDVYRIGHFDHDIIDLEGRSEVSIGNSTSVWAIDGWFDYGGRRIVTGDHKDLIRVFHTENAVVRSGGGGDRIEVAESFDITVHAGGGNDTIEGASEAYGANGRDVIRYAGFADGGRGADWVDAVIAWGGTGNDTVYGEDTAYGEEGADLVTGAQAYGGEGNDTIEAWDVGYGEAGRDVMRGALLYGGDGNDTIEMCEEGHGEAGHDMLTGALLYGGNGNDTLTATAEGHPNDRDEHPTPKAFGGAGDDLMSGPILFGEDGDDTLEATELGHGGGGDDVITGGGTLNGANGVDTLAGTADSDDLLLGGRGADVIEFALGQGDDIMRGEGGADTYLLTAYAPTELPAFIDTVDSIEGFEHGLDAIDLRAKSGVTAFDDLVIAQVGSLVSISDTAGYVLVVAIDDIAARFTPDDFVF